MQEVSCRPAERAIPALSSRWILRKVVTMVVRVVPNAPKRLEDKPLHLYPPLLHVSEPSGRWARARAGRSWVAADHELNTPWRQARLRATVGQRPDPTIVRQPELSMNIIPLPIDTLAPFLLGGLLGAVICGFCCWRRHDRVLSDGEPGYTHRTAE